ncbi:hypothetical protein KR059_012883, partial [Drosophila kikkawai]
MDRSTNPTPINQNAKYLPDSISNVLNSIHKLDQGTLAWPTGPRKRTSWTNAISRVPLTGTASSLISNSTPWSKYCERIAKKNTFYQILKASQDQAGLEKSLRRKRIACNCESNPHGDSIYNDIYDIVRTYLEFKTHAQPKADPCPRADSPKLSPLKVPPPVKEIYRVRPRVAETPTLQKYSNGEKWKSKSSEANKPIVEAYRPRGKRYEPKTISLSSFHKTVSKSKRQKSGQDQNISQEFAKESGKVHHDSSTAQSHRKQVKKAQKRNTDFQSKKGNAKESSKLQLRSAKTGPRLKKDARAVQEAILANPKKTKDPHHQDKLQNKTLAKKNESKERLILTHISPNVENAQDNQRESLPLQDQSSANKEESKEILKSQNENPIDENHQDNIRGSAKLQNKSKENSKLHYETPKGAHSPENHRRSIRLDNKYTANKETSKGILKLQHKTPKVPYSQDSSKLQNKSLSKFQYESSKAENSQDDPTGRVKFQDKPHTIKPEGLKFKKSSADQHHERIVPKPETKTSKTHLGHIIANQSNNETRRSRRMAVYLPNKFERESMDTFSDKFVSKLLKEMNRIGTKSKRVLTNRNSESGSSYVSDLSSAMSQIFSKPRKSTIRKDSKTFFNTRRSLRPIFTNNKASRRSYIQPISIKSGSSHTSAPASPYIPSNTSSIAPEPVMTSRPSVDRKRFLEMRASRNSVFPSYQEKLKKLKEFLNKHYMDDDAEIDFLDLEGILQSDLLFYPYNDIYNKYKVIEGKDNNVVKQKNKTKPKPSKMVKKCLKSVKKKSACCMCKAIQRPQKEAPFLVEMRRKQKRQELMAYRAQMAMCHEPSQMSNRTRKLAISNLDKKLYFLEDKDIVFSRPKRSNSSIFPSSS